MKRKNKTVWLYLDGKKHCDVVMWALGANLELSTAKEMLKEQYRNHESVEFKIQ